MLISPEKNFLFVHIPKTAGSSIRANLRPYCVRTQKLGPLKVFSKLGIAPNWRWEVTSRQNRGLPVPHQHVHEAIAHPD